MLQGRGTDYGARPIVREERVGSGITVKVKKKTSRNAINRCVPVTPTQRKFGTVPLNIRIPRVVLNLVSWCLLYLHCTSTTFTCLYVHVNIIFTCWHSHRRLFAYKVGFTLKSQISYHRLLGWEGTFSGEIQKNPKCPGFGARVCLILIYYFRV